MNRPARLLLVTVLAAACFVGRDVCVANVNFPFNSSQEGWEFGVILPGSGTNTPYWFWEKDNSSNNGAIKTLLLATGSGAGAWAMSPCLVFNDSQNKVAVDISHFTLFPEGVLGQVQYQLNTGAGWGNWTGIPVGNWLTPPNHIPPTEPLVFPPLLSSSGTFYDPSNTWLAFSGTNISSGTTGSHLPSAFTLTYGTPGTDLGPGVVNGDEIRFRFLLGVDRDITVSGTTPDILWEVNEVEINGVQLCEPVPEPGTLVMAGSAVLVGLAAARRSRARSRRRTP